MAKSTAIVTSCLSHANDHSFSVPAIQQFLGDFLVSFGLTSGGPGGGGPGRSVGGVDLRPRVVRVDAGRRVDLSRGRVLVGGRLVGLLTLVSLVSLMTLVSLVRLMRLVARVCGAGTGLVGPVETAGPLLVVVMVRTRLGRGVETRMRFAEVERSRLARPGPQAVLSGVRGGGSGQPVQS